MPWVEKDAIECVEETPALVVEGDRDPSAEEGPVSCVEGDPMFCVEEDPVPMRDSLASSEA